MHRWLSSFIPAPIAVNWRERLRSCVGALLGIAVTGGSMFLLRSSAADIPLLVAPMGASAVLLFAVPASPLAQPWAIMGGNIVSAIIGVTCAYLIADPVLAAASAVSLSIGAMFLLRCVHPPSGAVALTAVLGGPALHALGYRFVLEPIAMQSALLLVTAMAYHAATGHRYPHVGSVRREAPGTPSDAASIGFTRADLQAVLANRGELLDIDPGDLESLLRDVELQAISRNINALSCADVMSRHVVSTTPSNSVASAWRQLKRNQVKALAVIDAERKLVGIVTRADLAEKRAAGRSSLARLKDFKSGLLGENVHKMHVASLMTTDVVAIRSTAPITELLPMFANSGHHHIPVIDTTGQVVGMITQLNLISSLYQQTTLGAAPSN